MTQRPAPAPDPLLEEVRALAARREWPRIVERVSPLVGEVEEPETLFHYADALRRVGRTPDALCAAEGLETPVRQRGDRRLRVNLVNLIGICLFELGRNAAAEERFGELMELAGEWGDEEFAGRACNNLGMLANVRGDPDGALGWYGRAVAFYQRLGYTRGLAQTHHNLGISYRDLGHEDEADAHYLRAIELAAAAASEDVVALAETERAVLRARAGDGELAGTLAGRARDRYERIGDPLGRAEAVRVLALASRTAGRDDQAALHLEEAFAVARDASDPLLLAEVQRDRGLLLRDRGEVAAARDALEDAAGQFERIGAAADAATVRSLLQELPAGA
ncbi:MAG: tetratricopeptide repeat protein [Gemmatimonadetes bacterium]|nr:tetratricopeptide repeat protein [Gemmatimonadota bacterium]